MQKASEEQVALTGSLSYKQIMLHLINQLIFIAYPQTHTQKRMRQVSWRLIGIYHIWERNWNKKANAKMARSGNAEDIWWPCFPTALIQNARLHRRKFSKDCNNLRSLGKGSVTYWAFLIISVGQLEAFAPFAGGQRQQRVALPRRQGRTVRRSAADQCAHPVWPFALSLTVSSLVCE